MCTIKNTYAQINVETRGRFKKNCRIRNYFYERGFAC